MKLTVRAEGMGDVRVTQGIVPNMWGLNTRTATAFVKGDCKPALAFS